MLYGGVSQDTKDYGGGWNLSLAHPTSYTFILRDKGKKSFSPFQPRAFATISNILYSRQSTQAFHILYI